MKLACDDGGYVHPWECCATGGCNVFCCNCAGHCRTNDTIATATTTLTTLGSYADDTETVLIRQRRAILSGMAKNRMMDKLVLQHDMQAVDVSLI